MYFGKNGRKKLQQNLKKSFFHIKMDFNKYKNIFINLNRVESDRCDIDLSDETIRT